MESWGFQGDVSEYCETLLTSLWLPLDLLPTLLVLETPEVDTVAMGLCFQFAHLHDPVSIFPYFVLQLQR